MISLSQPLLTCLSACKGCGKTTQIPAFLLEEFPLDAKIVVAQPRRLAATGVAARVANERGEDRPGIGSVGYVVRGDTAICKTLAFYSAQRESFSGRCNARMHSTVLLILWSMKFTSDT